MSKGNLLNAPHVSAEKEESNALGFERLVFFSDAVLAIAITLMALEIRIPELAPARAAEQIGAALATLVPHIFVYVLSFLVIGLYWTIHHRLFRLIQHYNSGLIWFNLIFLMTVAFVPVATNAFGTYPQLGLTTAFYAVSVALVGLSEVALWTYATRHNFTRTPEGAPFSRYFVLRMLVPPLVFLLSIPIAVFSPDLAQISWASMMPIMYALRFLFPEGHAQRERVFEGED